MIFFRLKANGNILLPLSSLYALLVLSLLTIGLNVSIAQARPVKEKHILMLYAYGYGGRGVELFSDGFFDAITGAGFPVSNVHAEYLDLQRNKDVPNYRQNLTEMLLKKYGPSQIDLIITVQQPALEYLLKDCNGIAPDAPVITLQNRPLLESEKMGRSIVGEINQFDIKGTLERALELFPQTRKVLFASGSSAADIKVIEQASKIAESFGNDIEFEYTTDMTLDEILDKVAHLPSRSIIIFTQYNRDTEGRVALAYEVENMIVRAASAPVFGFYDYNLKNGGIGGSVIPVKSSGSRTGRLAVDILNGASLTTSGTLQTNENIPMFDWEVIQHWKGDVRRLPANTVFVNRTPSVWQQYGGIVAFTMIFIIIQSVMIVVLLINIRRRKIAERVLDKRDADLHAIFENIFDSVVFTDSERHICRVNPSFMRMFGYTADEVLGHTTEFLYADPADYSEQGRRRFHKGSDCESGIYEVRYRRKDGSFFWAESSGTRIVDQNGSVVGMLGVHRDISERKQTEKALRKSEATYRSLFENMLNSVVHARMIFQGDIPIDLEYISTNPAFATVTGITEPVVGRRISEVITGYCENNPESILTFGQVAMTGKPTRWEHYLKELDRWFSFIIYSPSYGEVIIVTENITERKHAENQLKDSEKRLRLALDATSDAIWDWNLISGKVYRSPRYFEIVGRQPDETMQDFEFFKTTVLPDDLPRVLGIIEAHKKGLSSSIEFIYKLASNDEEEKWMGVKGRVVERDANGSPLRIVGTLTDITEQKQHEDEKSRLEEQIQQSRKMESVGRLAGGVAHDFNNMLGIILGYAEMTIDQINESHPLYANLDEIRNAANRSADLTKQLLAFARQQPIAPKALDLNDTVEGMLKMLRRIIGEDIDLVWLPGKNLWKVNMDPSQIDQLLANLCVNARDAISGVGKMTIETENAIFDSEYCADHAGFTEGEYVMLTVGDNGCGMDKETQSHIFEPFFTTKEIGKGTGLGLATIYGIIKQNKGFINVYSEQGQGTVFTIYLPRHMDEEDLAQNDIIEEPAAHGQEVILVVEDEPVLLNMTTMMLERKGYTVLAASTPDEAISLAETYSEKIRLLITDVVMPGMNGKDLAKKITSVNPSLKCLFASGYTADVIAHHGVLEPGVNFIHKPFSVKSLASKVRDVLDG